MGTVLFTEYVLPRGETREVAFDTDADTSRRADEIGDRGYRFEVERLSTGDISATIVDPVLEEDVDIEIIQNAPGTVTVGVNAMIDRFHARMVSSGRFAGA